MAEVAGLSEGSRLTERKEWFRMTPPLLSLRCPQVTCEKGKAFTQLHVLSLISINHRDKNESLLTLSLALLPLERV